MPEHLMLAASTLAVVFVARAFHGSVKPWAMKWPLGP